MLLRRKSKTKNKKSFRKSKFKFGRTSKKMSKKYRNSSIKIGLCVAAGLGALGLGGYYYTLNKQKQKQKQIQEEKQKLYEKNEVKELNAFVKSNLVSFENFDKTEGKRLNDIKEIYVDKLINLKEDFYDQYVKTFFDTNGGNEIEFSLYGPGKEDYFVVNNNKTFLEDEDIQVYNRLFGHYLIKLLLRDYNIKDSRPNIIYFIPYPYGTKLRIEEGMIFVGKDVLDFGRNIKNKELIKDSFSQNYHSAFDPMKDMGVVRFLCVVKRENIDVNKMAYILKDLTHDQIRSIGIIHKVVNDIDFYKNNTINEDTGELIFYDTELFTTES